MIKEKVLINIENIERAECALNKSVSNPVEVELWGESKTGGHFLAVYGTSYVVFEKSPEDSIGGDSLCRYVGSTPIGYEKTDFTVDDIIWREYGGCVRILFSNTFEYGIKTTVTVVWNRELYERSERPFRTKKDDPKFLERKNLARSYLGKRVEIFMDRPLGYVHRKLNYTLTYPVNYGFTPSVVGGDGEEFDVYLLGIDVPMKIYTAKIIAVVHRENDVEDKLVAAPEGVEFTKEEIAEQIAFQEKYFVSFIETEESFFEFSLKEGFADRKLPDELEHYLLNRLICPRENGIFRFPSWKEFDYLDEFKHMREVNEDEISDRCFRPELICSPRTLFLALWRKFVFRNPEVPDDVKINVRFYFKEGNLTMEVDSLG